VFYLLNRRLLMDHILWSKCINRFHRNIGNNDRIEIVDSFCLCTTTVCVRYDLLIGAFVFFVSVEIILLFFIISMSYLVSFSLSFFLTHTHTHTHY
jgi:uncharacterized membrane protein